MTTNTIHPPSLTELKAQAYDCIAVIEKAKARLNELNKQIAAQAQKERDDNARVLDK
jgi:hypothetical protein